MEFTGTRSTMITERHEYKLTRLDILRLMHLAGKGVPEDAEVKVVGDRAPIYLDDKYLLVSFKDSKGHSEPIVETPVYGRVLTPEELKPLLPQFPRITPIGSQHFREAIRNPQPSDDDSGMHQ